MAADKPYPKQPEGLTLGASGIPPKFGTFTSPADYLVDQDAEIERRLQAEQEAVARIVSDAVTLWAGGTSEASKAALRQRAETLSPAARITARLLTKHWLDAKYPRKQSH